MSVVRVQRIAPFSGEKLVNDGAPRHVVEQRRAALATEQFVFEPKDRTEARCRLFVRVPPFDGDRVLASVLNRTDNVGDVVLDDTHGFVVLVKRHGGGSMVCALEREHDQDCVVGSPRCLLKWCWILQYD